ncbi:hypothetical protein [Bosea lathyri]|uniref:Uncharacterized protein n=1 Tax=Bosea lathyri TaxID=1036778 RepID=A0A1H5Z3V7_9HYPH|nr:hypothetical protein [Bosea lathyri]SEG30854.1 hypothetical protein SAMN04488115_104234 [Bosea lathyri]
MAKKRHAGQGEPYGRSLPAHHVRSERFASDDIDAAVQHVSACGLKLSIRPLGPRPGRIELNAVSRALDGVIFIRSGFEEPEKGASEPPAGSFSFFGTLRGALRSFTRHDHSRRRSR